MASERQIAANRQNAQLSTGPRTPGGKGQSSRNGVTHGLTAPNRLLAGENPEDLLQMRDDLIKELMPESALELEFVDRIVSILWRLRRVPAFEVALMVLIEARSGTPGSHIASYLDRFGKSDRPSMKEAENQVLLGRTIETFLKWDFSGKLSRYETTLQRQLSSLLRELRDVQARRNCASQTEQPEPTPS